jgi:hypothetical protein
MATHQTSNHLPLLATMMNRQTLGGQHSTQPWWFCLLVSIGLLVALATWPAAKKLARDAELPLFAQTAQRLWWQHVAALIMLAAIAAIQIVAVRS